MFYRRFENGRIKKIFVLLCFFLFWPAAARADFSGPVDRVIDGDTIAVERAGQAVKIRLFGIDCPESGQAFGDRAAIATRKLCGGETVRVIEHGPDRYGRTVGEVILPDGRELGHELVRLGWAWWYRKYAPKDRDLGELENEARKAGRGLWAAPRPIPPWQWHTRR